MLAFSLLEAPEYSPENFLRRTLIQAKWIKSLFLEIGKSKDMAKCITLIYGTIFPINPPYVPTENPTGIYKRTFAIDETFHDKKSFYVLWRRFSLSCLGERP